MSPIPGKILRTTGVTLRRRDRWGRELQVVGIEVHDVDGLALVEPTRLEDAADAAVRERRHARDGSLDPGELVLAPDARGGDDDLRTRLDHARARRPDVNQVGQIEGVGVWALTVLDPAGLQHEAITVVQVAGVGYDDALVAGDVVLGDDAESDVLRGHGALGVKVSTQKGAPEGALL
jgi:hypothetical protein